MSQMDLTKDADYDIRYFEEVDMIFLKSLLLKEEIGHWFPVSTETDVDLFLRNWLGFSRHKCALTAIYKGKPIGFGCLFLLPYQKVAIHALSYLVVNPDFQRMGVGTSLLRNLIHLSRKFQIVEKIQIECYEGCPIQSVLEKLSFEKMFVQERFVKYLTPTPHYKARLVFERSNRIEV